MTLKDMALLQSRVDSSANSEELIGLLFLFVGPFLAFLVALVIGW